MLKDCSFQPATLLVGNMWILVESTSERAFPTRSWLQSHQTILIWFDTYEYLVCGFNPSEKYESQLGLLFLIYGKFMFQTTNQVYVISYSLFHQLTNQRRLMHHNSHHFSHSWNLPTHPGVHFLNACNVRCRKPSILVQKTSQCVLKSQFLALEYCNFPLFSEAFTQVWGLPPGYLT